MRVGESEVICRPSATTQSSDLDRLQRGGEKENKRNTASHAGDINASHMVKG